MITKVHWIENCTTYVVLVVFTIMSSVDVYGIPDSAPCRILYMTCEAIGISYNSIICDLFKKENWTDQYLKVLF